MANIEVDKTKTEQAPQAADVAAGTLPYAIPPKQPPMEALHSDYAPASKHSTNSKLDNANHNGLHLQDQHEAHKIESLVPGHTAKPFESIPDNSSSSAARDPRGLQQQAYQNGITVKLTQVYGSKEDQTIVYGLFKEYSKPNGDIQSYQIGNPIALKRSQPDYFSIRDRKIAESLHKHLSHPPIEVESQIASNSDDPATLQQQSGWAIPIDIETSPQAWQQLDNLRQSDPDIAPALVCISGKGAGRIYHYKLLSGSYESQPVAVFGNSSAFVSERNSALSQQAASLLPDTGQELQAQLIDSPTGDFKHAVYAGIMPKTHAVLDKAYQVGYSVELLDVRNEQYYFHLINRPYAFDDNRGNVVQGRWEGSMITLSSEEFHDLKQRDTLLSTAVQGELEKLPLYQRRSRVLDHITTAKQSNSVASLVTWAQNLDNTSLHAGDEYRYSKALCEILVQSRRPGDLSAQQLRGLAVALMHTLEDIEAAHPSYFQRLEHQDPDLPIRFAIQVAEQLVVRREQLAERALFQPGKRLIGLVGEERKFSSDSMKAACKQFGMREEDLHVYQQKSGNPEHNPLPSYLQALRTAAGERETPSVVWHHTHGEQSLLYASEAHGENGELTVSQLAKALIDGQIARGHNEIDLSHIDLIFDSCYAYDFTVQLEKGLLTKALAEIAAQKELELKAGPAIVVTAPRGSVSWNAPEAHRQSFLQSALSRMPRQEALHYQELMTIDQQFTSQYDREVSDWKTRRERNLAQVEAQYLAVFSPEPVEIEELLSAVETRLEAEGLKIPKNLHPASSQRHKHFMEVSSLGGQTGKHPV